jgi:hypothetical protein
MYVGRALLEAASTILPPIRKDQAADHLTNALFASSYCFREDDLSLPIAPKRLNLTGHVNHIYAEAAINAKH